MCAAQQQAPAVKTSTRPLRVVVLSEYYQPEPAAVAPFAEALAGHLVARGHDVSVLTGMPNYPDGHRYEGYAALRVRKERGRQGERIIRVPEFADHSTSALRRGLHYFSFVLSTMTFAARPLRNADVVYVCGSPVTAGLVPMLLRTLGRGPAYMVHAQDLWPESVVSTGFAGKTLQGRAVKKAADHVSRLVYGHAERVVAISPGVASQLADRPYIDSGKIRVIPNWADESRAVGQAAPSANGPLRLMYAGNVGSAQGLTVLLDAMAQARHRRLAVHLDIVGDGTELSMLKRQARDHELDNVRFHGRRPAHEMAEWYNRAELQVVSLRQDPLFDITIPSKVSQLLYHGLPILCVANGDAADIVEQAGAGWAVRSQSPSEVVACLETALAERDQLSDRGRAGRDYYAAHLAREHGVGRLASQLLELA